jgi:hypothetical protein
MHKELFQNNPQLKPKWHDFKPAMIKEQFETSINSRPLSNVIVPVDIFDDNVPNNSGQGHTWSRYTTQNHNYPSATGTPQFPVNPINAEEFTCHILGDHIQTSAIMPVGNVTTTTSVGALESWINSRPDMNPVSTISDAELDEMQMDPLTMLFNDGGADDEIIENFNNAIDGDGDQEGDSFPMYHLQRPVDTPMEVASAAVSSAAPVAYFTGFNALLGQVLLKVDASVTSIVDFVQKVDIVIDVNPRGMTI